MKKQVSIIHFSNFLTTKYIEPTEGDRQGKVWPLLVSRRLPEGYVCETSKAHTSPSLDTPGGFWIYYTPIIDNFDLIL